MKGAQETQNYHGGVSQLLRDLLTDAGNGTQNAALAIEAELQMLLGIADTD